MAVTADDPSRQRKAVKRMNLRTTRLLAAVAGSLALLASFAPASAQPADDYPARPITVVVPYPPGGPPDVIARIVASSMEAQLGKAIIIENEAKLRQLQSVSQWPGADSC